MSKNNDYLDPMLAGASASLYGLENQEAVKESFPLIYQKLVDSFDDPEFIAKLHALKGRGQTTVGINLPKKNEAFRFVNKIWFQVQKSDSEYWEVYYLNIGFNFNHSKYNPFEYQKMMIKKVALGPSIKSERESLHQTLPRALRKSFLTMCMIPSLKMHLVSSPLQTKQRMELLPKKKTRN